MRPAVRIHTFGCRLNQVESESLAEAFSRAGFAVASGGADADAEAQPALLLVFNTCTVTSKAEQKARRLIRSALRADPRAVAVVTGCYAQMEPGALSSLGDRVVVVPGSAKDALLGLPGILAEDDGGHGDPLDAVREALALLTGKPRDPFAFSPGAFSFHSRASLKVEDGCGNACAYCRVRLARGPAVSLDPGEALRRVRALEASGYAEAVLTGVNLSHYSAGGLGFPGLLSRLIEGTERIAFRISSYEPSGIDGDFLELAAHPRIRPFFHLPIQSGCAATLARMGRDADTGALAEAIEGLRRARKDPFLSFDMICGFPGESDAEFRESEGFARRARPAWIHVFPYSPRPGTPAASLPGRVPERVAAQRAAVLAELARTGRAEYAERWFGEEVEAVLEIPILGEGEGGEAGEAFSENALRIGLYPGEGQEATAIDPASGKGRGLRLRLGPPRSGDFDASAFLSRPC